MNWAILLALLLQFIVAVYNYGRLSYRIEDAQVHIEQVEKHVDDVRALLIQHMTQFNQIKPAHED